MLRSILKTAYIITIYLVSFSLNDCLALSPPHGGKLINRIVSAPEFNKLLSQSHQKMEITDKSKNDIQCLAYGIYSPLTGFMNQEDYRNVVDHMRLSNDILWPIPVALDVSKQLANDLKRGQYLALYTDGKPIAVLEVEDIYTYNKEQESKQTYNTNSMEHPGVKLIASQGDYYVGGKIYVKEGAFNDDIFREKTLYPSEARKQFKEKGWNSVVAFQTRNPLHRAHEYLLKTALESTDGLFLNPLVGATKKDDVPAHVRMKTYEVMKENYFNPDHVILSVFPAAMRYAGPKEAILHAIARQNYGCTHMIVGRDHAGVGKFYGPFDAQEIFSTLKDGDLAIHIMKFDNAFYCAKTGSMATEKTCPPSSERIELSGTKVRQILGEGGQLPTEVSRPEVARVLSEHYSNERENQK